MNLKSVFWLLLFCFAAGAVSAQNNSKTLTGCSGKSIENYGIRRDVYGIWMDGLVGVFRQGY